MQLIDTDNTVTVTGGEAIEMTMDATSAIGFSLSIDKLYVHKIESVVREICSNARDSHVEAGIPDQPFDVFLPSDLSPYLVIKDHGTGLSKDNAIKYLSKLYSSSKQNSNKAVGAYGIGSKSPFAISDSYNIETVLDGIKCSFQFFRSGRSLPQLMLLDESATDEPNGVTFRIHVRDLQRHKYEEALQTQLFMFNPKPTIDGAPWPYDPPEVTLSSGNVTGYKAELQRDFFGAYALEMGGVTYPFAPESVDEECDQMFRAIKDTMGWKDILVISVPIGSVEVPGDRERVEYSEYTIQNLKIELSSVASVFTQERVTEYVERFNSQTDLVSAFREMTHFQNNMKYMIPFIVESTELEVTRSWKPYSTPIVNGTGELVDVIVELSAKNLSRVALQWEFTAPHFVEEVQTKGLVDGKPADVVVKHIKPKYSMAKANKVWDKTQYVLDKYEDLLSLRSGATALMTRENHAIVLIDTTTKPIAKTIECWQQEDGNEKFSYISVVRTNDKSLDVRSFEDLFKNIFTTSETKLFKLSELKYTAKATAKVTNATGFRALTVDYRYFTASVQPSRYNPKAVQIKLNELNDFLAGDEKSDFFAYAFVDVEDNTIYSDVHHNKPVEAKWFHLMASAHHHGKRVLLMSKTTAKKHLETIIETGIPPLSDILDDKTFMQGRSKEFHALLVNMIHMFVFSEDRLQHLAKYAQPYILYLYGHIFRTNNPATQRYSTSIEPVYIANDLFTDQYRRTRIRDIAKSECEMNLWREVFIIMRLATEYPDSYQGRKVQNIFYNMQGLYTDKAAEENLIRVEKQSKFVPSELNDFLIKSALEIMPRDLVLSAARRLEAKSTRQKFRFN